jgi:hypothetical protein
LFFKPHKFVSIGLLKSHLGMVLETASGLSSGQIPQTQGLVPRTGQSVVAIGRQNDIADEMRVAVQTLLGNSVVLLVTGQLPDDQGAICGRKDKKKSLVRKEVNNSKATLLGSKMEQI